MNTITEPFLTLTTPFLSVLALVAAVLGLLALWMAVFRVTRLQAQQKALANQLAELEKNAGILVSGSLGMGQRIMSLEKKLKALDERQTGIGVAEMDFSYSQAHSMIDQGVDAGTVAVNTGLSRSEIDLMQLLHRTTKKSVYE